MAYFRRFSINLPVKYISKIFKSHDQTAACNLKNMNVFNICTKFIIENSKEHWSRGLGEYHP